MASAAPFVLSRVTESDMQELVDLEYDCFPDFVRQVFMGCFSKDDTPKIKQSYVEKMQEDPNDVWIKVVDKQSGHIIAASNWKLYINGKSGGGVQDDAPDGLDGEVLEKSKAILKKTNDKRALAMPGPFIHLHICFTHPEYRRRGAGGMMLKWGCDVADLLGLPGWIEASEEGNFLYKMFGFYDYEKLEGELPGTNMKRDPRESSFQGGK